jgi:hypothetical protein
LEAETFSAIPNHLQVMGDSFVSRLRPNMYLNSFMA